MLDGFFVINHRLRHDGSIIWGIVIIQLRADVVIVVFVEVTWDRN